MKSKLPLLIILMFSTLIFANDKEARGALIQKKFQSSRKDLKKCLEYEGRQVFPTFMVKFAIKEGKAQDISFPGSELKENEVSCMEGVLKKLDFTGVASAQVQQNINFRAQSGSD